MNLRTLRYFIAVADSGSLTAAAAAIPVAQPALTRQMRELEGELGVQLLQRLPRGIRLTQAGVTLYESAQRMLAEADRVARRLAARPEQAKDPIVLGAPPTLARLLLPHLYEQCFDAGIQLKAREAFTPALMDWLERGMIDMAVLTNPEPRSALSLQPLLGEPFALMSHASLRVGPRVTITQLARIPLLMTSLHRGLIDSQLARLGKSLQVQAEIDSVDSIHDLLLRGRWATIMPVSVFRVGPPSQQNPGIRMAEISGVQLNRLLVLATRVDSRPHPSLSMAHDLVLGEFSRLERQGYFNFAAPKERPDNMQVDGAQ